MKKIKIVKKILICTAIFLLTATLYIVLGTTLPYIKHKAPSDEALNKAENTVYTGDGSQSEKIKNIADNKDALIYRLKMIAEAKEEIILTTFEYFDDESGRDVLTALWSAAKRGVKVKLFIDGYQASEIKSSPYLKLLSSHENAEVKFYNELNPIFPWKAQSRMHEKYLICDRSIYLIGGRNTNDRFLGNYPSEIVSRDRELLVISDIDSPDSSVKALCEYFDKYFEHKDAKKYTSKNTDITEAAEKRYNDLKEKYQKAYDGSDISSGSYQAKKVTLITGDTSTGNRTPDVYYQLIELMKKGSDILIQTPYIMCGDEMYKSLTELASDRSVKLFINSPLTGSNLFGGVDYLTQKDKILATQMTIYEHTSNTPFHTKTLVIDDSLTVVGSFNFDMRSTYLDSELMLVVDCEELNSDIRAELDIITSSSRCVSPDGSITDGKEYFEPETSTSDNIKRFLIKIFTRPIRFLL